MKTKLSFIAVVALFLPACLIHADEARDKAELVRVEKAAAAALVANDAKALREYLSEDWRIVSADATTMKRSELFQVLEDGTLIFESYKLSDLEVRVYGDAAVVIGHGDSRMKWKGDVIQGKEIFTDVFVRREGKWQCVSSHSCDIPEAESQ